MQRAGVVKTVMSVLLASQATCVISRRSSSQVATMNAQLAGQASSVTCTSAMTQHVQLAGPARTVINVLLATVVTCV